MKRHRPGMSFLLALCLGVGLNLSGLTGHCAILQLAAPPLLVQQTPSERPADGASLPVAAPSAQTPTSPFHIAGVVLDAVTKSPVPHATLTVLPMTTVKKDRRSRRHFQKSSDSAITDSDGRFDLSVPAAGGWELTATARSYGAQRLDEHNGYSTAVVLTEAQPRFNLEFLLTPASIVEGFVLDEAGEAIRGANVSLIYLPPPAPETQHPRPQGHGQQMTDDRGFYKFAAISPGTYQVKVTAQPWYATAASGTPMLGFSSLRDEASANSGLDPLDVVYPTVWFPGATDPSAATPIVLRGGDTQEADFRLLPVAGSHLHLAGAGDAADNQREQRPPPPNTFLTRVVPDGTDEPVMTPLRMDGNGNADIAGLAPGTYLVHQQLAGGNSMSLSTIQIGTGSARTLSLREAVPAATVTVQVDPVADQDSLQIAFRDSETSNTLYATRNQDFGRRTPRHRGQARNQGASPNLDDQTAQNPAAPLPDRTVSLPSGKYEVFLNGVGDLHLSGIEATGATATGRTVTIGTGAAKLFLHTASGFGLVTGIVNLRGQPDPGAMVLLIPATLGNPSGFDLPSRDQSNSDGSFEMSGLLPGGYILVAIDHGWDINWADPSTLRRLLMHGVALDIKAGSDLKQTIEAQSP